MLYRYLCAATLAGIALSASAGAQALQPVGVVPAGSETAVQTAVHAFSASNMTLLAQLPSSAFGGSGGNDCWGYTSPSGREYAIFCMSASTGWVEITNPSSPNIVFTHPGPSSSWHDAKVFEDHCYVVSEGGSGIKVYDMSAIDSGTVTYLGDVTVGGATNSHNVVINEDSGFLYRVGTGSGTLVYDLNQSKTNPPFVGSWNGHYVHDAQVHTYTSGPAAGKEVMLACVEGSGMWTVDFTNKASVTLMDTVTWPTVGYSHQGWLDQNEQYFYINDEFDESNFGLDTTTYVIDVSDPNNISLVSTFDNNIPSIGHNGYVTDDDLLFEANYTSGVRVFDLSVNPLNPPEIGWYDTYPANDDPTYNGLWSCYPFFPSGVVIGSDTSAGLFIWWMGDPLVSVSIAAVPPALLAPSGQVLPVTITELNTGDLQGGTETLHYDAGSGWTSAPLVHLGGTSYQAQFPGLPCGDSVSYYFSADSTNGLTWTDPPEGQAGPYSGVVATSQTIVFQDDFETDKGWVPSNQGATSGDFDRGVPVNDPNWSYDPISDSDGSGQCWVTENAFGNTDIDNGTVRLRSPDLDLSGGNVVVQYDYYCNLTVEDGVDKILVTAQDMISASGWKEVARHDTSGGTAWRTHQITEADFTAAGVPLTSQVRLRFDANDTGAASIHEAGLDAFVVKTLACDSVLTYCAAGTSASGCQAEMSGTGTPSLSLASGFTVAAKNGEGNKSGLFYFGQNGKQANPWGNGTSFQCVVPPLRRTPLQTATGTNGNCDASFLLDFNAYVSAVPAKAPSAGSPVQMQFWYRDPANTSNQTTSLSNALEFTMAP